MSPSQPRIAIVGGGPAGLTTGLLLHRRGIPFTIFELRQKPTEEELAKPSGMLDLHEESGIAALKECGLYEEFLQLTGECSEAQKVSDKDGNILYQDDGEDSERPEISRHNLTKMLLGHIPADRIKWGHKLLSATTVATTAGGTDKASSSSPTEIELDFGIGDGSGAGTQQRFDLVVGADGAWSKVRRMLTDVKPEYTGTQSISLTARNVSTRYPEIDELVGRGSFSSLARHHGVMSQRGPQDSVRVYVFLSLPDEHDPRLARMAAGPAAAIAKVNENGNDKDMSPLLADPTLLGDFGPKIKHLVTVLCKEESADNPGANAEVRPLYMIPPGSTWEHNPGAVIIGDSCHVMGPWAGEGVNVAMWDALDLSRAIFEAYEKTNSNSEGGEKEKEEDEEASFQSALDPFLKKFELEMVERAKEKADESISNGKMLFCEDGAAAFRDFFLSFRPPPEQS